MSPRSNFFYCPLNSSHIQYSLTSIVFVKHVLFSNVMSSHCAWVSIIKRQDILFSINIVNHRVTLTVCCCCNAIYCLVRPPSGKILNNFDVKNIFLAQILTAVFLIQNANMQMQIVLRSGSWSMFNWY